MRFFAGFLSASVLWSGVFYAYSTGLFGPKEEADLGAGQAAVAAAEPETGLSDKKGRRRRGRGPRGQAQGARRGDQGTDSVGDDIGWDDGQELDMAGGEQQLTGTQIEAGFDSAMQRIRRCLILVPSDGEIAGQLTFGMRVASDGKPKAVNLTGPSIVTGGESGDCLRTAAQGIRFASFDGPDAVFKFPVTLH